VIHLRVSATPPHIPVANGYLPLSRYCRSAAANGYGEVTQRCHTRGGQCHGAAI